MNLKVQGRVGQWALRCFGSVMATNRWERAMRVLEEAIELAQASGVNTAQAGRLLARVYSRPTGVAAQEVGGIGITLLAYGEAANIDVMKQIEEELKRISKPETMNRIREKQAEKVGAGVGLGVAVAGKGE